MYTRDGQKLAASKARTLRDAAGVGRLEALQVLRDQLAGMIENPNTPAHAIANLTRQFREVLSDLAALQPPKESPLDEVARARAARRAAVQAHAAGGQ